MKKTSLFTLFLVLPMVVHAQPVEEEITNDTPTYEIEVIESPAQIEKPQTIEPVVPLGQTENKQIQPTAIEPIGEIAKPVAPESSTSTDASGNTWNFGAGISVKPIGYNGYEKETYGEISPNASLGTTFTTGAGKKISFDLGYAFIWDEFYDKSKGTDRYFEHDSSLGLGMDITDKWSTSLGLGFNYSVRANPNDREFTIISGNSLKFSYKATDAFSAYLGYGIDLFNLPDGAIYDSSIGIPSDIDDVRQGDFTFDDSGFFNNFSATDEVIQPNSWWANNKAKLGMSYAIPKGPKINLDYDFVFETFNNSSGLDWNGHYITLKLSQSAWEGGSISLKNNLRLRNYQSKTIDAGDLKKDQRNRTDLAISQQITDQIGVTAWYRLQMTSDNSTSKWTPAHNWFLQTSFSF